MTNTPLISVIVPVYKTEKYLEKCLSSIAAQTLHNFEVLCINDQSPDGSAEILNAYEVNDKRFKHILHEQNLGLSGARNTGLRLAKANYIASVDSDDWIEPDMLEKAYAGTQNEKHDIVCFGFNRVDGQGAIISRHGFPPRITSVTGNENIFGTFNPAFWNKLWRKSLYLDNDILFPPKIYGQDLATSPRILTKAKSINFIAEPLYNYLARDDSATAQFDSKHLVDYIIVFDTLKEFLQKEDLWEKYKSSFMSDVVTNGLRFHAENLMRSDLSDKEKTDYLRHILLLREAYCQSNDQLSNLDQSQLVHLIGNDTRVSAVTSQDGERILPVSIIIKAFLRPNALERLLLSIGEVQETQGLVFDEILVGDDSPSVDKLASHKAIRRAQYLHENLRIRYIDLGENVGCSLGRNSLVEKSRNSTILLCDDDFVFDLECSFAECFKQFQESGLDIMGGWLKNHYNFTDHTWSYWGAIGKIYENERAKIYLLDERPQAGLNKSDYLLNFFFAKREIILNSPYASELRGEEHPEFFYRLWRRGTNMALSDKLFIKHSGDRKENPKRYNEFRHGKEHWESYLFQSIRLSGKSVRRMYRWRDAEFRSWEVDVESGKNRQTAVPLKPPVLDGKIAVKRLTDRFRNFSYGYYDTPAVSADGRFGAVQSIPVLDQVPDPRETAEIYLIDLEDKNKKIMVGKTNSWCHQQGAHLQFLPGPDLRVIYNIFDEGERHYRSVIYNHSTTADQMLDRPIAAVAPSGKVAASINFSRLFDYRPGYGYSNVSDPFAGENAPESDGLFILDLVTGRAFLELSYAKIASTLAINEYSNFKSEKWLINHVQFSPDSSKLFMLVRVFSEDPPYPTFSVVYDLNTKAMSHVFGFGSHYHWKDNEVICISGSPEFSRQDAQKDFGVFEVNVGSKEYKRLELDEFQNDGHCSYSPDGSMLLYDSYSNTQFPYRALYVYDLKTERLGTVGYFWSEPKLTGNNVDTRCDLHPRWSADGRHITFDLTHQGFRAVYSIEVSDVRNLINSEISSFKRSDLIKLHQLNVPKRDDGKRNVTDAEAIRVKRKLEETRNSLSYQLGHVIVLAVSKPGVNTFLMPWRLVKLAAGRLIRS